MAPKTAPESVDGGPQLRIIANLLGILATKDLGEGERVATLNAAGFSNNEIARLLGKELNNVRQALFQYNKSKPKRRK